MGIYAPPLRTTPVDRWQTPNHFYTMPHCGASPTAVRVLPLTTVGTRIRVDYHTIPDPWWLRLRPRHALVPRMFPRRAMCPNPADPLKMRNPLNARQFVSQRENILVAQRESSAHEHCQNPVTLRGQRVKRLPSSALALRQASGPEPA